MLLFLKMQVFYFILLQVVCCIITFFMNMHNHGSNDPRGMRFLQAYLVASGLAFLHIFITGGYYASL